jgi:urease accessory protein
MTAAAAPGSPGQGALRFVRAGSRTVVHTARAASPLRLLLPRNHGVASWAYVASLGGGLVDGDAISLTVDVDAGGCALLGTQASTKVYRSPRGTSQALRARVGAGALLAVIPDPVTCFAGASYEQRIDVELEDESATLVLVDMLTCGRAARGERWAFARYASRTRVSIAGRVLMMDAVLLDREQGDPAARMGRFDAVATLVAVGPRATGVRDGLLAAAASVPSPASTRLHSATVLSPGACIGRVGAVSAHEAIAAVRALLAPIAGPLGDDPFARRW